VDVCSQQLSALLLLLFFLCVPQDGVGPVEICRKEADWRWLKQQQQQQAYDGWAAVCGGTAGALAWAVRL
jgi:hypothetical protein